MYVVCNDSVVLHAVTRFMRRITGWFAMQKRLASYWVFQYFAHRDFCIRIFYLNFLLYILT